MVTASTETYALSLHDALPILLYRHRFVDQWYVNGWAWTWPTLIGVFAAPAHTLDSAGVLEATDRKSTRLNSSHLVISYAVFCLKKKRDTEEQQIRDEKA